MFVWHHVLGYLVHSTAHAEQATYHCLIYAMIHEKTLYINPLRKDKKNYIQNGI